MGTNTIFDHHHVHLTFPNRSRVQTNHQDSATDLRSKNFDIQIIYFPHEVTAEMGGTRYVPGTHLRIINQSQIARYQNIRGQVRHRLQDTKISVAKSVWCVLPAPPSFSTTESGVVAGRIRVMSQESCINFEYNDLDLNLSNGILLISPRKEYGVGKDPN